nr:ATP-dependent endonuclease [Bacteriovorax sp. HI3]
MKLKTIKITHFRGIHNLELDLRDYTTIIGPNNSCKSSVLKAIELFLDQSKLAKDDWHQHDFDTAIEIEGQFEEIQNWERRKPGIASLVQNDKILLRMQAVYDKKNDKIETTYEAFLQDEKIPEFDDATWTTLPKEVKTFAEGQGLTSKNWNSKSNKETLKNFIRKHHSDKIIKGESKWTSEGISIKEALKQALPQVVIISASLNIGEELKTTAKTPFGKLLETVIFPALKNTTEFESFETAMNKLVAKVKGDGVEQIDEVKNLSKDLSDRMDSILSGTKVNLTLANPEVSKIISGGATVKLNDGFETEVEKQGHGAQRSLIFALIEVLAKRSALSKGERGVDDKEEIRSTLLLFEEPELYLHPHLMRRLKSALEQISKSDSWQCLCTTHSPFLIDVAKDPLSLIILQKNESRKLSFKQLKADPFVGKTKERDSLRALLDFHPTVCESFFAKQVVLVEGDTEIAFFSLVKNYLEYLNISPHSYESTTIVSCDGKWTIAPIALLLKTFGIPFKIIHDEDRKGRSDEELLQISGSDEYKANERILDIVGDDKLIFKVADTFENVLWANGAPFSKDKPFKAWKETKAIFEEGRIEEYAQLKKILKFSYA